MKDYHPVEASRFFKESVQNVLKNVMEELMFHGYTKKEVVRALRHELKHKNELQQDLVDEMAEKVWE